MYEDFFILLAIGGSMQGTFLGVFLLAVKKGNLRANRLLGLLLLLMAYLAFINIIFYNHYLLKLPHLSFTQSAIAFLMAPCYYFYLEILNQKARKVGWNTILHFLPFLIFLFLVMDFYLLSAEAKRELLSNIFEGRIALRFEPFNKNYFYLALISQFLLYTIFMLKMIFFEENRYKGKTHKGLYAFTFFWLFIVIETVLRYFFFYEPKTSIYLSISISFGMYALAYWILSKEGFFLHIINQNKKYQKVAFPVEVGVQLSKQIILTLEEDFLFRDPDLSASKLAQKISISNHRLSQLINEELNETFYDLVNRMRIEDAKSKLKNSSFDHLTIEGIGKESGFKSKSSFYRAFKKFTGQTPSEFQRS